MNAVLYTQDYLAVAVLDINPGWFRGTDIIKEAVVVEYSGKDAEERVLTFRLRTINLETEKDRHAKINMLVCVDQQTSNTMIEIFHAPHNEHRQQWFRRWFHRNSR